MSRSSRMHAGALGIAASLAVSFVVSHAAAQTAGDAEDRFARGGGEAPPPAPAKARPKHFGDAGSVVITGAFGVGLSWRDYDDANVYSHAFDVDPEVHVFVAEGLSLGLAVRGGWSRDQGYSTRGSIDRTTVTSFGAGLGIGYNFSIGRRVSFWPRAFFGVSSASYVTESDTQAASGEYGHSPDLGGLYWEHKASGPYVYAFAPLLFHPVPHFFVGIGPSLFRELGVTRENSYPAKNDRTSFGITNTVGIWF